ncbi:MAG: 4Fe-4S binding protein [Desulfopila sp.]
MIGTFTVCFLRQKGASTPEFLISEMDLHPGRHQPFFAATDVLLASGFSSLAPQAAFPLSASLQLNQDIGRLERRQLAQLAQIELQRLQQTSFHRYTVEPDPRLCVVGPDSGRLQEFVDTYGGILDITPFLVGSYDPLLPGIIDLTVSQMESGLRLQYSQRSPIDLERCTYCGACGAACPEGCVDEYLFVDFRFCTFCRACETACSQGAIDIHGGRYHRFETPALLVLDHTELQLPEVRDNIYGECALAHYFASQGVVQVDEVITCDPAICQYSARHRMGCRICRDGCPQGAVTGGDLGIVVDSVRCTGCGACVAACPTGAMRYERFTDESFISYVTALRPEKAMLVLGSEKALHRLWWQRPALEVETIFVEYPQIGALSLFHLLLLFAAGATRVVLLTAEDSPGNAALAGNITLAKTLLATWFGCKDRLLLLPVGGFMAITEARAQVSLAPLFSRPLDGDRRRNLVSLLAHFIESSGRQAAISGGDAAAFATITCASQGCTLCFACLEVCRLQALSTDEAGLCLVASSALCVGCGACVQICPENVLTMLKGARLDRDFLASGPLARGGVVTCRGVRPLANRTSLDN